jgi:glucose-1-phosphate cytidylyltransferase
MVVVILAGGKGTRLSEETHLKPKPMVEIGGKPLLWHIMKHYSAYGINEFVICCGYKGYTIKEYFANYSLHMSDVTFEFRENNIKVHESNVEPWKVTLVDTGHNTLTGGRLRRVRDYIGNETFCFTYGDGLSDVNIKELVEFHKNNKALATLTAIQPVGRFGGLTLNENHVTTFKEKPRGDGGWINGGYFVLEAEVVDMIEGDDTVWEQEPLERLANNGQLVAYKHRGFWEAMDTMRDKIYLESLWENNKAAWINL